MCSLTLGVHAQRVLGLSVKSHLTYGASDRPEIDVTYNEGKKNCLKLLHCGDPALPILHDHMYRRPFFTHVCYTYEHAHTGSYAPKACTSVLFVPLSLCIIIVLYTHCAQGWPTSVRWWDSWNVNWISIGWAAHIIYYQCLVRFLLGQAQRSAGELAVSCYAVHIMCYVLVLHDPLELVHVHVAHCVCGPYIFSGSQRLICIKLIILHSYTEHMYNVHVHVYTCTSNVLLSCKYTCPAQGRIQNSKKGGAKVCGVAVSMFWSMLFLGGSGGMLPRENFAI